MARVEVVEIDAAVGVGIVATRAIAKGTTICEDRPLWTTTRDAALADASFVGRPDVRATLESCAALAADGAPSGEAETLARPPRGTVAVD